MNVQYIDPLSRGFERMKSALFQPFDPKIWFVVGFTAFLAGLTDYHRGGDTGFKNRGSVNWEDILYLPEKIWEWLINNPLWFTLVIIAMVVIIILAVLFTWLSSRGKFMFLDNVIHRRALVVAPWHEYRREGNSLFVWSFSFGLLAFGIIVVYVVTCFLSLYGLYEGTNDSGLLIAPAIFMGLGLITMFLLISFIELLLEDFIVPIMYKNRVSMVEALRLFFPLLVAHFFRFFAYALLVLLVTVFLIAGIVMVGLLTCCIGFLVLIIPYINAVVLLPISYTMRAFSVEFLEQFGPEYHFFPRRATNPATTETTTS
ncbi:MAG: hypothetical protein V1799_21605 [bacterium]